MKTWWLRSGLSELPARPWLAALLCGLSSPLVFASIRDLANRLGYSPYPLFVSLPNATLEPWIVAPGAFLAGWILAWTLGPPRAGGDGARLAWGTFLGAVLGWANAPLSVLVALLWERVAGDDTPALFTLWLTNLPWMLVLAWPVAVPCGAWLGSLVAALGLLARPRTAEDRSPSSGPAPEAPPP